jgi:hypothetical protein
MRIVRRGLGALVLVLCAVLGTQQAASAAVPDGAAIAKRVFGFANPKTAYAALSPQEKLAFDKYETPMSVTTTGVAPSLAAKSVLAAAAFKGCWARSSSQSVRNAIGATLYSYGQSTQVCVSGGKVTSVTVYNTWHSVSGFGWRWDGESTTTYNVAWEGRGLAQGKFILGAGGWDIMHDYPCLQLRLNANGHDIGASMSCNLN